LEATLIEDLEAVQRHFERLFGAAVAPRRPLTVLVFERVEWYDLHLDGHLPAAGVYWMGIDRQIMICEELCLRWMTEPRWIWRQLLVRYFFEQHKGFSPPSNLASLLAHSLLCELDPYLTRRVHRRARTMFCRGDAESAGMVEALNLPDRQLLAAMLDPQHSSHLTVNRFSTACALLAEYLMGDAAGQGAERFRGLLRQWQRKDSLGERLQQHLEMDAAALERDWRQWMSGQPTEPSGQPSATIQRYFQSGVLPQIVDARVPLEQRLRLIRHLGASGYELGIDALIGLLQDHRAADLHADVVWALESISGQPHGADIAAWRTWWIERRTQLGRQPAVEFLPDEADVFVAQLAGENLQPVTAELVDNGSTPFQVQEGADAGGAPKPAFQQDDGDAQDAPTPRRLMFLWGLLWLGGLIAVGWSVRVAIVVGPSSHPPGTHEEAAGARLMKYCLENMIGGRASRPRSGISGPTIRQRWTVWRRSSLSAISSRRCGCLTRRPS
jgi:hypothetical protein